MMALREFLTHCTANGGNYTAMYLSGIDALRKTNPEFQIVWDNLPDTTLDFMQVIDSIKHLVDLQ